MTTVEEILKLGEADPEQTEAVEKMGPPPKMDWSDMATVRNPRKQMFMKMLEATGVTSPHCTQSDLEIPLRDGATSHSKLFKPTHPAPGGSPFVVLFFGGGFVMGFPEQMTFYARDLAELYGATVVAVDYRLAPEHRFPTPMHDAWDLLKWLSEHAAQLGADPSKGFVVGGVSAGAHLSIVSAGQYVEEGHSPPITGLWLSVPFIYALPEHVPTKYRHLYLAVEQNAYTPVLDRDTIDNMRRLLQPDLNSKIYSPGLRTEVESKLPPVYFQVCGMDPLRDDALIYNSVLKDAGRKTLVHTYPGMVHAGWAFFPTLKQSKQAHVDFQVGLGWLLGMEPRKDPAEGAKGGLGA